MFIVTQLIGLYVVNFYSLPGAALPYGLQNTPTENPGFSLLNFVIAFVVALAIFLILLRSKLSKWIIRIWMFLVVLLSLTISLGAFFNFSYSVYFVLALSLVLSVLKIFKRDTIIHNFTELLIYPGIAVIFVSFFNIYTIAIVLVLISIYDIYAVWHSGFMQKMATYQIQEVKIFSGFFVPYLSKKQREELKKYKLAAQKSKSLMRKGKQMKVNIAILGGGDVVFPIITSGVVMLAWGLIPALIVTLGATLALCYLFFVGEKRKFYPAMPYITTGIFIGMIVAWLVKTYLLG